MIIETIEQFTADYHNQMNAEIFKKWFVELLNNLEEPSVIVMDNASYHSTLIENYPKSNWRKADVQKWLTEKILNLVRSKRYQNFKKLKA